MRYPAVVLSAALASAACTSSGGGTDKADPQAVFEACATKVLQDAKIGNPMATLTNEDFRVTGSLSASKGEMEWQGKKVEADVSTTVIFALVGGQSSVVVSDTKRTSKHPVRPETTETTLPADGIAYRGVNASPMMWSLHSCARKAHQPS